MYNVVLRKYESTKVLPYVVRKYSLVYEYFRKYFRSTRTVHVRVHVHVHVHMHARNNIYLRIYFRGLQIFNKLQYTYCTVLSSFVPSYLLYISTIIVHTT